MPTILDEPLIFILSWPSPGVKDTLKRVAEKPEFSMHVAREVERRISAAAAAEEKARRPPTSEAAMLSFILVIGSGQSWEEMSGYCFLRSIGLRKVRMVKTGSFALSAVYYYSCTPMGENCNRNR